MQQYWAATRWSGYLMAVLLAASVTAAAGAGDTEQAQTDARTQAVRALLADWDRADTPGAAVSVTLDGVEVANVAVGQADLEQGVAVSASTVFHAASLSKQVTAFAILLLEQDGRLAIDAPLARYLPEAAVLGPLSLRQLLNHTSGLRDQWTLLAAAGWRSEDLVSDEQVLRLLLRQRGGNAAPGTAYQYTNSGYALLAEVVRRVSGQSLAAFCRERIFAPLGMEHSRFQDDLQPLLPHRASSYHRGGEGYLRDVLSYASAGPSGLQTTTADLGRWAANLEQPRLGGVALVQRLQEQGVLVDGTVNDYALGQERRRYHGLDTWSHGGRDAGYRSFLLRIPGQRFSVAVLANAAEFDSARVAFAIADLYLSARPDYQPSAPVPSRPPSRRQLAAYAGDYELFPGVIFHLDSDGRQLFFSSYGSAAREALPALSASSFQLNAQRDLAIEFAPGGAAPASGLRYRIGLHGSLPARRVQLQPFAATQVALDELVGDYYSDELDTRYELRIVDGRLLALHARRPGIVLNAYQPDTFASSEWFFQKLQFERDGQGRISGFRLSGAIAEGIGFRRAPAR